MAYLSSATNWIPDLGRPCLDESDLVRAARYGDKDAFQRLVCLYDRLVLTFALHLSDSEEDAREIYEQVFLKAFQDLPAQTVKTSLFVWICRITTICCGQYLSRNSREHRSSSFHKSSDSQWSEVAERTSDALRQRLSLLSVRERMVFVMAQCGRLRAGTIAEILQVPELSVKQALVRAVYKLSNTEPPGDES